MTIKKKIQTKYRLPVLNWTPMKPQQVKGTVFADLDDEKLYHVSYRPHVVLSLNGIRVHCLMISMMKNYTI